ncbi:unnamed protein product [Orchesella dallaii]|uniref:Uncharacterized protein n=1 Tax=Orchesella dallaii TaxID=48710 RepID=A0ABP1PTW5_9HEXA
MAQRDLLPTSFSGGDGIESSTSASTVSTESDPSSEEETAGETESENVSVSETQSDKEVSKEPDYEPWTQVYGQHQDDLVDDRSPRVKKLRAAKMTLDFPKGLVDFVGVCQRVGLVKPDKPLTPDLLAIMFLKYSGCSSSNGGVRGIICEEKGDIPSNPTASVGEEMVEIAPIVVTASNNKKSSSVNLGGIPSEERKEICAHHTLPVSAELAGNAPIVVAASDILQNCFVRLEKSKMMKGW